MVRNRVGIVILGFALVGCRTSDEPISALPTDGVRSEVAVAGTGGVVELPPTALERDRSCGCGDAGKKQLLVAHTVVSPPLVRNQISRNGCTYSGFA